MLKLLAVALDDGWAFVNEGDRIFVVRPPYRKSNLSEVDESALETAVAKHGFLVMEKEFSGWDSLIGFLNDELIKAREARGQALPGRDEVRKLVGHANKEVLVSYLDRIERELIPNREWGAASELLTTMIGLDIVRNDTELNERTIDLLRGCGRAKEEAETAKRQLVYSEAAIKAHFPLASGKYPPGAIMEKANSISGKGQILSLGTG